MLDLALVLVAVLAGVTGWRAGGTARALRLVGLTTGALVGLGAAGLLSTRLSPVVHLVLGAACACGGALVGSTFGRTAGARVIGVVNALSGRGGAQGYAITLDELRPVLAAATSHPTAGTGTC